MLLVGAYDSTEGGADVLAALLCHLHHLPVCCYMRLFCCGRLNTSSQGQPLAQGLCYDVKTKLSHCRPSDDTAGAPSQQQLPLKQDPQPSNADPQVHSAGKQCMLYRQLCLWRIGM